MQKKRQVLPVYYLKDITTWRDHDEKAVQSDQTSQPQRPRSPPRLLVDGYGIHAGDSFRARFPDGWHDITLEVAWEITGPGCWYISTPGYEDVCPVGLFVET